MSQLPEIKEKLKALGAKTTGNKAVLTERLKKWTECNLNQTLCDITNIPAKSECDFPENVTYEPLNNIKKGDICLSEEMIEEWFFERNAKKGLKKGRILSMKLFVKYTKVYINGNNVYIKSVCAAEMKKHVDYNLLIKLSKKTSSSKLQIEQCRCGCPAGVGWSAACKHVAAVCYSLEHFNITGRALEYTSCTSEPMKWNKPSVSGRAVEYMSIYDITQNQKQEYSYDDINTDELLNKLVAYSITSPLLECRKANMISFINDHSLYTKQYCFLKLKEINKVSSDQRSDIEAATRMQSLAKTWFVARRSRITGSIIGDVLKTVEFNRYSENPALKNLLPAKNLNYIPAVKWGRTNEPVAKDLYMKITGNDISSSGIWVHHIHNFLASSPDGVNFDLDLVIEIKCPYSIREESPTNAKFLNEKNGIFSLKRNHVYYAQCQLHMYTTNTSHCDFIVWTNKAIFIEHISEDKRFQVDLVNKAEDYFKNIFAPLYLKMY